MQKKRCYKAIHIVHIEVFFFLLLSIVIPAIFTCVSMCLKKTHTHKHNKHMTNEIEFNTLTTNKQTGDEKRRHFFPFTLR